MKNFAVFALLCGMSIVFAAEVNYANIFTSSKVGADRPFGWSASISPKTAGGGKIIQLEGSAAKAFKAELKAGSSNYWRSSPIAAKEGDSVEITMVVTGKGIMNIGIYTYTGLSTFFPAVRGTQTVILNGKKQTIKANFAVRNGAKGQICDNIRPFFRVERNSNALIESYSFKVTKK